MAVAVSNDSIRELLQVKSPSEVVEYLNVLVYGEAGAGKTYFGGTADDDERTKPLLVFDVEGGLATLRRRSGVDVTPPIRSLKDFTNKYNELYRSIDKETGQLYYKTLMIDSLTELTALDMRSIMDEAYNKNPETVDKDVPSPREWGKAREHMRTIVRALRDLPCNIVFTAALGSHTEENTNITRFYPAFAGKLRADIPGFVDIVGYLYADNSGGGDVVRRLQVTGTRRVVAKDRTSALGDVVENPTIPMLWDLINAPQTQI